MNITLLGALSGMLLLIPPFYILYHYGVNLYPKIIKSVLKMMLSTALTALFVYYILHWNNAAITILSFFIMAGVTSLSVLIKAQLTLKRHFVPVAAGTTIAVLLTVLYLSLFTFGVGNPIDARFFIPIAGLLFGNMVSINSKALNMFYMGLRHHNQLYYYLLGNGATHAEATRHFMRRCLEKTVIPNLSQMAALATGSAPVVLWGMLLGGTSVVYAAVSQVVLFLSMLCSTVVSTAVTLWISARYMKDNDAQIAMQKNDIDTNQTV